MTGAGRVEALGALGRRLQRRYGPWAVVTGASDGIGREIAERLADAGFNLAVVARREDVLRDLAPGLEKRSGGQVRILPLDLGDPASTAAVVSGTADLDIGLLVACAGFGTSGRFVDADPEIELDMVDVNCRSVLALTHHFAVKFVDRGQGGIVLMSSLLAFQGVPLAANYAATKAYVQTLAEGLRLELAPKGVDVLACAPGPIHSGFAERADMVMGLGQTPQAVGRATLHALGRRTTVRPGWLSKLLEASFVGLPRVARSRILARVMGGMTRHQQAASETT